MKNDEINSLLDKKKSLLGKKYGIISSSMEQSISFNDTDSAGISLKALGRVICKDNSVTDEGYKIISELGACLNDNFKKWFIEKTNTKRVTINFIREKICDVGIWLGKKHYIVHILDDEGFKTNKFVYKGLELAKSTIAKEVKDSAKKVVENLMMTKDKMSTDVMFKELYEKYQEMPLEIKSTIKRVSNMDYEVTGLDDVIRCAVDRHEKGRLTLIDGELQYKSGTPGHVRSAINFNVALKVLGLNQYPENRAGDTLKIIKLDTNNPFKFKTIGYNGEYPKEFSKYFKLDDKNSFEKILYPVFESIYKAMRWNVYNPTQNYNFSLEELFKL